MAVTKTAVEGSYTPDGLVTYVVTLRNTGNEAVVATDNAVITDTFDPVLADLVVTYEGTVWTQGVQYSYDETTGLIPTAPGQVVVPAATYVQDPVTGAYTATPGTVTLTVTGTI